MPQGQGEQAPEACYPTPGLRLLGTLPKGPVRAIKQVTTGGIYAVGGDTLYRLDPTTWASTPVGTITGHRPYPVSLQDNGNTLVIVDGTTNGWTVDLGSNAFAAINDPAFYGADRVDYLDTYLLFNKPNTPQFYSSDSLATTFDSLYFANKESFSDLLITIAVAKREIWLFGERTTEIWYNSAAEVSGTVLFPFSEIQSVFVDHGCRAKYSVATYDDAVYWLSYDRAGQGIVLSGAGYLSKRISTFAIEAELAKYPTISDAIGMVYSLGGHVFYVLTFPTADHTWVYDITSPSGQWHEWAWIDNNGEEHRHRANCMYAINGMVVAGDWENGNLYAVENTALTDNGQPIKRQRAFPHLINEMDRVFYRQFIADIESGNPTGDTQGNEQTLVSCSFTAPDGTLLSAYHNAGDTNADWTLVSGTDIPIEGNELIAPSAGAVALYQTASSVSLADYTLQFRAIPAELAVASVFAIARSTGAGTGYRATVAGDGTQYQLTLGVEGAGSTTLAMGSTPTGFYAVTMTLQGPQITLAVQRSSDGLWLQSSGLWTSADVPAITLTDATYSLPGRVMIGGNWAARPTALSYTLETPLLPNPDWPSGYSDTGSGNQTFDFGRNRFYIPISTSGKAGIKVTDLNTMTVIKTPTMTEMYAGTPFGSPAGSPPFQGIYDATCGNNTDLYILAGGSAGLSNPGEFCRFTRVDPATMKVTGEFYIDAAFPPPIHNVMPGGWGGGVVNTTTSHTIVAYATNGGVGVGPQIFDGTGMAPIGLAATPLHNVNVLVVAGARHGDGSCDFLMLDPDSVHPTTGNIDIWRITVSDSLTLTSTKTGTLNVLPLFTPTTHLFVGEANYDATHDTIIVVATAGSSPNSAPSWLMSVNYNGTINWSVQRTDTGGGIFNKGQSNLTGTTYMAGGSNHLRMYDTGTGALTWSGGILVSGTEAGSFYTVWDASRNSYWTYALSRGFVRIDVHNPSLALDNLFAFAPLKAVGRQIFLEWSDDRGHSYGSPVGQPIGALGAYLTSVQWQRCGYGRDRIWRLTWSVPVATALQGAFIEADSRAKS